MNIHKEGRQRYQRIHFDFMVRSSTMEALYLLKMLIERYREGKKDIHMIFIGLEKTYDRVSKDFKAHSIINPRLVKQNLTSPPCERLWGYYTHVNRF